VQLKVIFLNAGNRDDDFKKFNARGDEIQLMKNQYRQMEMRLESYEKTQEKMEDNARSVISLFEPHCVQNFKCDPSGYRRQIQCLEAHLALANKKNEAARQIPADEIAAFVGEKTSLATANDKLREENADLMDEVEEMRAMLEMLKAQISGKRGLVSARASPIMFPS
jgi:phage shock protein A